MIVKMRAWDGSKMVQVHSLNFVPAEQSVTRKSGYTVNDTLGIPEEYLMLFTGKLDVDGKEIYSGDINVGVDNGNINEVWWDQEYSNFRNICRVSKSVLCRDGLFPLWQSFFARGELHSKPTIRVIGNIYENPELLRKQ